MDCKFSCFDRVMYLVQKLDEEKIWDACELITDYGFNDVLDYGIENGCFTKEQAQTLYEGIVMWEDLDGNYYEEDEDKLEMLYEHMGITSLHIREYQEQTSEEE